LVSSNGWYGSVGGSCFGSARTAADAHGGASRLPLILPRLVKQPV